MIASQMGEAEQAAYVGPSFEMPAGRDASENTAPGKFEDEDQKAPPESGDGGWESWFSMNGVNHA